MKTVTVMTIQIFSKRIAVSPTAQARGVMAPSVRVFPCELADNGIQNLNSGYPLGENDGLQIYS
jgi:hypothetical protein